MRWNFGGNLEPVRMICEYDWKECPIAVASYVWTEIVTDVVDSLTREIHLWRILAVMLLCSMLFHTVYHKTRWLDKSNGDVLTKDDLIKVGFKMQDLELKINILTYKMQYGTWPMPHEIPTPSLNQLRNVKLTLSNTSRRDMWTKHHLHGYISKCIQSSDDGKPAHKQQSSADDYVELKNDKFLSKFLNQRNHYDTEKDSRKFKLLGKEYGCRDYERLVRTAEECRRYMDEINESNKSLGLLDTSSDVSDQRSIKDIYMRVESELNSRRNFLMNQKQWEEEICEKKKQVNNKDGESEFATTLNFRQEDAATLATGKKDRQSSEASKTVSKNLPPGLSITFLSEKFKDVSSREKFPTNSSGVRNVNKINKRRTNESLNKVKDKLESYDDISRCTENSKSLSSIVGSMNGKKRSETIILADRNSAINSCKRDLKYGEKSPEILDNRIQSKYKGIFQNLVSTSGNETSETEFNTKSIPRETLITSREKMNGKNLSKSKSKTDRSNNQNNKIKNDVNFVIEDCQGKLPAKITSKIENLNTESDSSASFRIITDYTEGNVENRCGQFNLNENLQNRFDKNENTAVRNLVDTTSDSTSMEDNINLKLNRIDFPKVITKLELSRQKEEQFHYGTAMETDEDPTYISQTSSRTEVSKDSDTDEKSTTTLLREALEFKKALLMQIRTERSEEMTSDEKLEGNNASSGGECDSNDDDAKKLKTDNNFRSKILDIISEEQSAGSSTERTSRTYILSGAISETNILGKGGNKFLGESNNNSGYLESSKIVSNSECCGDSKNPVTATSSEYFSANNVTDNEHLSGQKINQYCIADGDGIREMEILCGIETPEGKMKLDKRLEKSEETEIPEWYKKTDINVKEDSIDIGKIENIITDTNSPISEREIIESIKINSNLESSIRDIAKNNANNNETCKNLCEKTIKGIDSITVNEEISKDSANIKFFRSLSSFDSEPAISWNSGSRSSSSDSIVQFVNTLASIESESIDAITEPKFPKLSSTDYEDKNFIAADGNSECHLNLQGKKCPSLVSLSGINVCERRNDVVEKISDKIIDQTTFEVNAKPEPRETNTTQNSNCLKSDSVLNFDQEKLERKENIFGKLKALDALTESLDIVECNSERNGRNDDVTLVSDHTVFCNRNSDSIQKTENFAKIEIKMVKSTIENYSAAKRASVSKSVDCVEELNCDSLVGVKEIETLDADNQYLLLGKKFEVTEKTEKQANLSTTKLEVIEVPSVEKNSKSESLAVEKSKNNEKDTKCELQLQIDKRNDLARRKSQLSRLSITNFSTDTSDPYFDVSNHDFAVSSIILTSQNSNLGNNQKFGTDNNSDTSSVYVDARDNSSKPDIDLSKNDQTVLPTDASKIELKHQSSTKTQQQLPKVTSSLPSNDHDSKNQHDQCPGLDDSTLLQEDLSNCSLNLNLEKISSKLNATTLRRGGKTASKSCIPVLKSRIEPPKRAKSMESKARSQSPIRRSITPLSQRSESSRTTVSTNGTNENYRQTLKQTISDGKKPLNGKRSYTLKCENSETGEERVSSKEECKIVKSISKELSTTPEKCNLLAAQGNLTKECTVIYINIISDADRNETQVADAKELIKYVNEQEAVLTAESLDSKSQSSSLKKMISNSSNKEVNPNSDEKVSKDLSNELIDESETFITRNKSVENNSERILPKSENLVKMANKILSTSTLEFSKSNKVSQKEIEVLAKPSIKSTSTSVSDFPDASLEKKRLFYNPNNEVFDISKKHVTKEEIIISEMLKSDTNIYECKKAHRLFNKLGLGFQEQPE